ncbi:MAG: aquaporin, partial [Rhizobiaceae bacterium]|nr:aquaporin [Rhizobiaceae bacterium]
MNTFPLSRRLVSEALGTAFLVTTIVGSGIMASKLTNDTALALLANTLATGAMLVVLIMVLGPISGAHFNPVVSLVFALRRELRLLSTLAYIVAQVFGGIAGVMLAHTMFGQPLLQISTTVRSGGAQWLAEVT